MADTYTNGRGNGTAVSDVRIILRIQPIDGRGIDLRALNKVFSEIECGLYDLEVQELNQLIADITRQLKGEDAERWSWAADAAYRRLKDRYEGRRYQIIRFEKEGFSCELAVTAAVFGVLKEAIDYAKMAYRLNGAHELLLRRAERSHGTTLATFRDRFQKSSLFDVQVDDDQRIILTAKLGRDDRALPTMAEFVKAAREGRGGGILSVLAAFFGQGDSGAGVGRGV